MKTLNVFEASFDRLRSVFSSFSNIIIPLSGGKDSGVVLNLVIKYLKKYRKIKNNIIVYHLDYELQYTKTDRFIFDILFELKKVCSFDYYHICMPFKAECSLSYGQSFFRPWELDKKDIWIRKLPKNSINIFNHNFDFWNEDLTDYDFNLLFLKWLYEKYSSNNSVVLSGFRLNELEEDYKDIFDKGVLKNQNLYLKKIYNDLYFSYLLYEWSLEDIWVATFKYDFLYNQIYEDFYILGVDLKKMKEASSFNSNVLFLLKYLKQVDPFLWERANKRVSGVEFATLFYETKAFGNDDFLPRGYNYLKYLNFLLNSLDEDLRNNFLSKFKILFSKGINLTFKQKCEMILRYEYNKKYKSQNS